VIWPYRDDEIEDVPEPDDPQEEAFWDSVDAARSRFKEGW